MFGEDFAVGLPDFVPGGYTLSVSGIDVFEQSGSVERSFTITGIRLYIDTSLKLSVSAHACFLIFLWPGMT